MSEAAEVPPMDCGPHPKAKHAWCPTCGVERYPRYGDDDAAKVRKRCQTEGCRGHMVSLKLHPRPLIAPDTWRGWWLRNGLALIGLLIGGALGRWLF